MLADRANRNGWQPRLARATLLGNLVSMSARPALLCAVDDSTGAREALRAASTASKRAGLRLVLVHCSPGFGFPAAEDSLSGRQARAGATQLLDRLVGDHELSSVERRV